MDEWDVANTHPSWCDCYCCNQTKHNPLNILLLPILPFMLIGAWAKDKKAKKEYEEQQKAYEEEQKLEKARQTAGMRSNMPNS